MLSQQSSLSDSVHSPIFHERDLRIIVHYVRPVENAPALDAGVFRTRVIDAAQFCAPLLVLARIPACDCLLVSSSHGLIGEAETSGLVGAFDEMVLLSEDHTRRAITPATAGRTHKARKRHENHGDCGSPWATAFGQHACREPPRGPLGAVVLRLLHDRSQAGKPDRRPCL